MKIGERKEHLWEKKNVNTLEMENEKLNSFVAVVDVWNCRSHLQLRDVFSCEWFAVAMDAC